jgi:uncharacterized protein VirK/YbjX
MDAMRLSRRVGNSWIRKVRSFSRIHLSGLSIVQSPSLSQITGTSENNILVLKVLTIVYREELAQPQGTFYSAIFRCAAAARILLFPRTIVQFKSMKLMAKLKHPTRNHDPLYFLAHHYYISRKFTLRQRVDVAMEHHKYELQIYNCEYMRQVYRSNGIVLWERSFADLHFTIVLIASPDNRHEGDLTVILYVNKIILCQMSFCYLKSDIFGLSPSMTMLVSRNQTDRTSFRQLFDQCFKQNTPQLFCLSAVCALALTHEFRTIFAIKHDAQIAYEEPLDPGFRNSYTALWEKFGAVEIDGHVFMLNVPLNLPPVGLVSRVHRQRARARRQYWDEIEQSTRLSMAKYRELSSSSSRSRDRRSQVFIESSLGQ